MEGSGSGSWCIPTGRDVGRQNAGGAVGDQRRRRERRIKHTVLLGLEARSQVSVSIVVW